MQKNEEYIIEITGYSSEGSGIGRVNSVVVFVPSAAAGDVVRVKILKVKKNCAFGKITEIITPSPSRIKNDCASFNQCGGCVYRHIRYEDECNIKSLKVYDAVKRIGGINMPPAELIPSEKQNHYRNKAQYPVSPDGFAGFYAFRSHRIVKCVSCPLQPEIFDKIISACSDWAVKNNISIYSEETHTGKLRHIYIRLAEKTEEIMVCLVINGTSLPFKDELTDILKSICKDRLKSFQININRDKTNIILGKECVTLFGSPYITDILCGVKVRLSPLSFYQVNRTTAEKLYKKAAEYAEPQGKTVLDLYCGAGTIGLSMASKAKKIIGVEIVPEAVEDARFNAKLNGIENAEFICSDASEAAKLLALKEINADVIIVDPPRKGCSAELISVITDKFKPERVVYVSCDPATFARDIKLFGEKGYVLREYTPVDMFPRTSHIETAAWFSLA